MAEPTIDQLTTSTLVSRTGKLADNISKNCFLIKRLMEKKNYKPASGRVIYQELEDAATESTQSYSEWEEFDVTPYRIMQTASFNWKLYVTPVVISGLEEDIQNVGAEAKINLVEAKVKNAEKSLMNRLITDIFLDGTGNGGKNIGGLALIVPDDPTGATTVGGIDPSVWTFWQSKRYRGVADGGAPVSAANIKKYLTAAKLAVKRNGEGPDYCSMDNEYYSYLSEALQAIQIISSTKTAEGGFETLKFQGMDCYPDEGANGGATGAHAWLLNTNYLYLRYAEKRNFSPVTPRNLTKQDGTVKGIFWAGNLTCSNRSLQNVLIA